MYVLIVCAFYVHDMHLYTIHTHTRKHTYIYIGMRPLVFDFICPCKNLLHMRQLSHHA